MLKPREGARAKERILAYGSMNSGKTFAWTTWAHLYRITETPGHFYVISTEWQAADRALEYYDDDVSNITIVEALNWEELTERTVKFREVAGEDDVLVFDSIGNAWSFVQDDYCEMRWGVGGKEYFGNLGKTEDSDINWQIVNARYQGWMNPNVLRFPGHVYATSPAEELRQPTKSGKETESKEARQLYGRYAMKPTGQKRLGYMLHSVLLMASPSKGEYTITSVDDHARTLLHNEVVAAPPLGFVATYLQGVAGWTL